ncbi:MAG: hypothetical protein JRM77_07035 [Nitrososphaerota archaeon]|nr:hypothetical protein [Nitrososphaerota archaeon]
MLDTKEPESLPLFKQVANAITKFTKSDSIEVWWRAEFHLSGKNGYSKYMTLPKKFIEESGLTTADFRAAMIRVFLPENREEFQGYANSNRPIGKIILVLELPDKRGKN